VEAAIILVMFVVALAAYGIGLFLGIRLAARIKLVPPSGAGGPLHAFGFKAWVWLVKVFVVLLMMLVASSLLLPVVLLLSAVT
jgi:hypothetical protein